MFSTVQCEPDGVCETLHTYRQAADVVADLVGHFAVADALRNHDADRLHPRPRIPSRQIFRDWHLEVGPRLLAPMPDVLSLVSPCLHTGEVSLPLLEDVVDHRPMQRVLIPLQRQDIVSFRLDDLFPAVQQVTIENDSASTVSLDPLSLTTAGYVQILGSLPKSLAAGATTQLLLELNPQQAGAITDPLSFQTAGTPSQVLNIPISALALGAAPALQLSTSTTVLPNAGGTFAFGTTALGTAINKSFTITNVSDQSVTVRLGSLPSGCGYSFGAFNSNLAHGASTSFPQILVCSDLFAARSCNIAGLGERVNFLGGVNRKGRPRKRRCRAHRSARHAKEAGWTGQARQEAGQE